MKTLVTFLFLLIFSCGERVRTGDPKDSDSIEGDNRFTEKRKINKLCNALNLPRVDQGTDSFELRVWSSFSISDIQMLTTLRFSDGVWYCTQSRYWIGKINEWGRNRSLYADSIFTRAITPRIPINELLDTLTQYEIAKIPDQDDIPGFVDRSADGISYTLEFSRPGHYKIINYHNPQKYQDTINKKVALLLRFLSQSIDVFTIE